MASANPMRRNHAGIAGHSFAQTRVSGAHAKAKVANREQPQRAERTVRSYAARPVNGSLVLRFPSAAMGRATTTNPHVFAPPIAERNAATNVAPRVRSARQIADAPNLAAPW